MASALRLSLALRMKPQPIFKMHKTPISSASQILVLMEMEAAVRRRMEETANQRDKPLPINVSLLSFVYLVN
ncbi:hypothetical protein D3C86_1955460 [compost metagenome]